MPDFICTLDAEGICTCCGVPDVHCHCEDTKACSNCGEQATHLGRDHYVPARAWDDDGTGEAIEPYWTCQK